MRVVGPGATGPGHQGWNPLGAITPLAFNDLGEVLFKATVTGGTGGYGLFVGTTAGLRKIASTTDSNLVGGQFFVLVVLVLEYGREVEQPRRRGVQ